MKKLIKKIKSNGSPGATYIFFVVIITMIVALVLTSLQAMDLILTRRVGTAQTTSNAYLTAESAMYSTIQQIKTTAGWPDSDDYEDSYKLDGATISRKITLESDGSKVIDIQSDYLGTQRRLIGEYSPGKSEKSESGKPIDMILILDRSSSMKSPPDKYSSAIEAAKILVNFLDPSQDQAAAVFFDKGILWASHLTSDLAYVDNEIGKVKIGQRTHILEGLHEGHKEVNDIYARDTAQQVIVIMSDGRPDDDIASTSECDSLFDDKDIDKKILCEADNIKADGTIIYSIAYGNGADKSLMRAIATDDEHYFFAPDPKDLIIVGDQIGNSIVTSYKFTIREVEPE